MSQSKCGLGLSVTQDGRVDVRWEFKAYSLQPPHTECQVIGSTILPLPVAEEILGEKHPVIAQARAKNELRKQDLIRSLERQIQTVKGGEAPPVRSTKEEVS